MISRYERERKKRGDKEDELQEVVVSKLQPLSLRSHTAKRVTPTTLLFPPPTVAADFGDPFVRSRIVVERSLPNGDVFSGEFSGSVPHGVGKYLWSDGCMYEGDWVDGKTTGNGKFSWPSGATYEGEFNGGFMDGFGTMVGVDGDTYRGTWAANQKHGFGRKTYGNGDTYEGYWKRDLREGEGKYVWKNDNVYEGEWRSGVIWGRGIFILAGGNRYEGWWENGVPTGELVSGFPDGYSFRVGNFGVNVAGDCLTRKRSSVCGRCRPIPDQICLWESDGEDGDVTCDIVNRNSLFSKGVSNGGHHHLFVGELSLARFTGEVKKQGQPICKGHKNYELMLSLQLGIRYSVGKSSASLMQELKSTDLDPKQRVRIRFPREGSKLTPPHQSVEFKWKDYCPAAFGHLRSLFKIDPADYMFSMCGNDAFRELSSPGKSGSFFYLTHDDRFMIKTVKKSEVKVLLRMLSSYYDHFHQYENSLVTKFYGVYCVKPIGGQKMRFIVMGNLFCSELRIHRRFDLKGSSYGRSTNKLEIDETTTLKDLDLNFVFRLERYWFHQLHKQIDRDCQFLEGERIMDYSLLVGLHFCDTSTLSLSLSKDSFLSEDKTPPISDCINSARLGANMPARVEQVYGQSNGGGSPSCDLYDVILYFGIIDILQGYDIGKKLENAYKSFHIDPVSISAVDPKLYSKRLRNFISRIFLED